MTEGARRLPVPAAIALGLFCAVVGIVVIVAAFRGVPTGSADPPWLAAAAGGVFVLAGAAIINGFAIARGTLSGGDLPPGTPFGVRLVQYVLGLAIVGSMTAILGWIAFAPGKRVFRLSGLPIPGLADGETTGRVAFGIGAVLMGIFLVVLAVTGARRLIRARSE